MWSKAPEKLWFLCTGRRRILGIGSPSERGSLAGIGSSPTPSDISGPRRGPMMERILAFRLLADDLTKFITSLNAGPVHLVSWSYGGLIAMSTALENPKLVRSLILYEPSVISVLPAESAEGKVAREDRFQSGCSSHRRE